MVWYGMVCCFYFRRHALHERQDVWNNTSSRGFSINMLIVVSFRIFKMYAVLVCPAGHRLSRAPPDPPRPRDRATPAPHSSPRRCARRRMGAAVQHGEQGGWKGAPGDRLARSPLWRGIIKSGNPGAISENMLCTRYQRTNVNYCCCRYC